MLQKPHIYKIVYIWPNVNNFVHSLYKISHMFSIIPCYLDGASRETENFPYVEISALQFQAFKAMREGAAAPGLTFSGAARISVRGNTLGGRPRGGPGAEPPGRRRIVEIFQQFS